MTNVITAVPKKKFKKNKWLLNLQNFSLLSLQTEITKNSYQIYEKT